MNNVKFNQNLVDEYIHSWNGVSVYNTENYNIGHSVLGLYFPSPSIGTKAYIFLKEWKNWLPDQELIFSIVKESETNYSFYFYKEGRYEFIKGTFQNNLILEDIQNFIKYDRKRKFVIIARFPNVDNDIIDYPHQDVIMLNSFKYSERNKIKTNSIEDN
ncbi:hypothetical protein [Flavobacterium panacagri]|uniref:hypothetical protein n=1 Tax=Flavobacterium panacagri TaxID=3034146 RepID=UPI0025A53DE3|nr:hypothetical protein [Flavobacterium panacagri]